jgi:hypothetical protein
VDKLEYKTLMRNIADSHKRMTDQQAKFDSGELKTYGGAMALQEERINLKNLRSRLPKPRAL